MQLDADELLARIAKAYPVEYELCRLRYLVDVQAARIGELEAPLNAATSASGVYSSRPFSLDDPEGSRHA